MSINYKGERFAGVNKPKRTPKHPKSSHAVLASENGKKKLIRFGQQGVTGDKKNIAKGKMSAAYWANKVKW